MDNHSPTKSKIGAQIAKAKREIKEDLNCILNLKFKNEASAKSEFSNIVRAHIIEYLVDKHPEKAVALTDWALGQDFNISFQDLNVSEKNNETSRKAITPSLCSNFTQNQAMSEKQESIESIMCYSEREEYFTKYLGLCSALHLDGSE
jgi:hypothetical protein